MMTLTILNINLINSKFIIILNRTRVCVPGRPATFYIHRGPTAGKCFHLLDGMSQTLSNPKMIVLPLLFFPGIKILKVWVGNTTADFFVLISKTHSYDLNS